MKKILIVSVVLMLVACSSSTVVTNQKLKQALDIAYEITNDLQEKAQCYHSCLDIWEHIAHSTWNKNMDCRVLDNSDVHGNKSIKGCLLQQASYGNENTLVLAEYAPSNRDIILLTLYAKANVTDKGFSFSSYYPGKVAVNLKTRKIGQL